MAAPGVGHGSPDLRTLGPRAIATVSGKLSAYSVRDLRRSLLDLHSGLRLINKEKHDG